MSSIKLRWAPLLVLLLLPAIALVASDPSREQLIAETGQQIQVNQEISWPVRVGFKLAPLFTFEHFERLFDKHYGSMLERMRRRKLVLGRVLRSLASQVRYLHFQATSYLGINQRSDETPGERMSQRISWRRFSVGSDRRVNVLRDDGYQKVAADLRRSGLLDELMSGTRNQRMRRSVPEALQGREVPDIPGTSGYESKPRAPSRASSLRAEVDHRESKCFGPVRNQGKCGSCYAFASVALYEYLYCMAQKPNETKRISLSEQFMLDCGAQFELDGCNGGALSKAVQFHNQLGLFYRKIYPYKNDVRQCPFAQLPFGSDPPSDHLTPISDTSSGWTPVYLQELDSELEQRPLLLALDLPPSFADYGGGVDSGENCDPEDTHAMLLVGRGRQDGQQYYLFRNSHGPRWGERGYYRFSSSALVRCSGNAFAVAAEAHFEPVASKTSDLSDVNKHGSSYNLRSRT